MNKITLEKERMMTIENCGAKQAKEGQINQELGKAEEACNYLVTQIDTLETQLSAVLQDIKPAPEPLIEVNAELVPLAHRIEAHGNLLRYQGRRLLDIMERLEIR